MVATEWWQTFFSGVVLDMWQQAIPPDYTELEAEFIDNLLHLPPGARILDAPCGEGRIARELAAKGYQVVGVDMAEEFLAAARTAYSGITFGALTPDGKGGIKRIAITLPPHYDDTCIPLAGERLAKSGYHLAELLNAIRWSD